MKKVILYALGIYLFLYLLFIYLSPLKYHESDFDRNGFISLFELFTSIDIQKEKVETDGKTCTVYVLLKDGLPLFERCEKLPKADLVIVDKSKQTLSLSKNGTIFKTYHIALGGNPKGHKQQEGDQKTPEGNYILDYKKADSAFYKAIHISYPNKKDIQNAQQHGVSPGGFIMIHGQKNGFGWLSFLTQKYNWTNGCIALTNEDMEEVWQSVRTPVPIKILP